ncbi:peroxin [Thalictrum thalictroides]|uniref:Peroxin n=1 Tax=Thalictrum thalictroides TaxID=46969 RepID=A0A7J6XAX3_THATH|nr:peroxin [Thalictrum thalictroides]
MPTSEVKVEDAINPLGRRQSARIFKIAGSMMRAQEVDPTNLEVLLALCVRHTNELEQAAALKYLYSWL